MPELPEVETVCRELDRPLHGRKIHEIRVYDEKLKHLKKVRFVGLVIQRVFRSGKRVVIEAANRSDRLFLAVHLRMTGNLILRSRVLRDARRVMLRKKQFADGAADERKHLRVSFVLDRGVLEFHDVRRFGTMEVLRSQAALAPAGIEPTSQSFNSEALGRLVQRSNQNIKQFLLRQDKIVGLGNIYASEILYACRIAPTRRVSSLSQTELRLVVKHTKIILAKAIRNAGTTVSDYRRSSGETGNFQGFLKVYGREGLPCRRCRAPIQRIVQQQRSTFFCKRCQAAL